VPPTRRELLGGSDQEEFARVLQDGYSGRLDRAIAIEQPAEVEVDEIVIRPAAQDF
jgi:hypothetical protein